MLIYLTSAHLSGARCDTIHLPPASVALPIAPGKEMVIAAIRALGYTPADDNEADALAILHWAMAQAVVGGKRHG